MIFLKKIICISAAALAVMAIMGGCSLKKSESPADQPASPDIITTTSVPSETEEYVPVTEPAPVLPELKAAEGTYVYGNTDFLSADDLKVCNDYAEYLYEERLINIAVVITDDLGEKTPYNYAEQAYEEIYEGRGSGMLLLINNDTNNDLLYLTGSCENYITEEQQDRAFFNATKDIINGDNKNAVLRLMKLGELCPSHVFDNSGELGEENVTSLEAKLAAGKNELSVLVTSNTTDKTNEEVLRSYCERRYKGGSGSMIMIDTAKKEMLAYSSGEQPEGLEAAISKAQTDVKSGSYPAALNSVIEAINK